MKKLSDVTYEDALIILSAAYKLLLERSKKWKLTDESKSLNESCKKLMSSENTYCFWFFDDSMSVDCEDNVGLTDANWDIKLACYLKAHEIGYDVPLLTEFVQSIKDDAKW